MKFETENGPTIANPTSEDLEKGIKSVDGKKSGFAILETGDLYIQAARNETNEFLMEYQNGSLDEHFSTAEPVTESEVINTFQAFACGDTSWFEQFSWEKMNLEKEKGKGCLPLMVMSIAAFGALAVVKNIQG